MTMTAYQQKLFQNLEALIVANEAFYRQQFIRDDKIYHVYNYRLASYTDFLALGALEARGTMFEVDQAGKAIRLATLGIHKFFNRFENPSTMDVDLAEIESIATKSDGSLISTYIHNEQLFLKSKGSLFSDQAIAAMYWLDQPENKDFKDYLMWYTWNNYTVNMEWVSPENRIILGYQEPKLIVLNVRDRLNGRYKTYYPEFDNYVSPIVDLKGLTMEGFVEQIPDMLEDIEGFVVKLYDGLWMKIKTKKYLSLHKCKDSINNPRRLFEAIVDEGVDDLRSMFHEDVWLMKQVDEMQQKVDHIFNNMVKVVETFYNTNQQLDRKEYAIAGQQQVDPLYFGLVMSKYLGRPTDYKEFLKKSYKHFGIKDEKIKLVIADDE